MTADVWTLLGISPGSDPRSIKRAYARLLKQANPEDDPAGFQRLRAAYEQAMARSKPQTSGHRRPLNPAPAPEPQTEQTSQRPTHSETETETPQHREHRPHAPKKPPTAPPPQNPPSARIRSTRQTDPVSQATATILRTLREAGEIAAIQVFDDLQRSEALLQLDRRENLEWRLVSALSQWQSTPYDFLAAMATVFCWEQDIHRHTNGLAEQIIVLQQRLRVRSLHAELKTRAGHLSFDGEAVRCLLGPLRPLRFRVLLMGQRGHMAMVKLLREIDIEAPELKQQLTAETVAWWRQNLLDPGPSYSQLWPYLLIPVLCLMLLYLLPAMLALPPPPGWAKYPVLILGAGLGVLAYRQRHWLRAFQPDITAEQMVLATVLMFVLWALLLWVAEAWMPGWSLGLRTRPTWGLLPCAVIALALSVNLSRCWERYQINDRLRRQQLITTSHVIAAVPLAFALWMVGLSADVLLERPGLMLLLSMVVALISSRVIGWLWQRLQLARRLGLQDFSIGQFMATLPIAVVLWALMLDQLERRSAQHLLGEHTALWFLLFSSVAAVALVIPSRRVLLRTLVPWWRRLTARLDQQLAPRHQQLRWLLLVVMLLSSLAVYLGGNNLQVLGFYGVAMVVLVWLKASLAWLLWLMLCALFTWVAIEDLVTQGLLPAWMYGQPLMAVHLTLLYRTLVVWIGGRLIQPNSQNRTGWEIVMMMVSAVVLIALMALFVEPSGDTASSQ